MAATVTGFIEDQVLRFEGLDDSDIAKVNAALPDIQHLDGVLLAEWPRINRLVTAIGPIIEKIVAKQKELST